MEMGRILDNFYVGHLEDRRSIGRWWLVVESKSKRSCDTFGTWRHAGVGVVPRCVQIWNASRTESV